MLAPGILLARQLRVMFPAMHLCLHWLLLFSVSLFLCNKPCNPRLVFAVHGGDGGKAGSVETVLIPMYNKDGSQPRYTICLSTQVRNV